MQNWPREGRWEKSLIAGEVPGSQRTQNWVLLGRCPQQRCSWLTFGDRDGIVSLPPAVVRLAAPRHVFPPEFTETCFHAVIKSSCKVPALQTASPRLFMQTVWEKQQEDHGVSGGCLAWKVTKTRAKTRGSPSRLPRGTCLRPALSPRTFAPLKQSLGGNSSSSRSLLLLISVALWAGERKAGVERRRCKREKSRFPSDTLHRVTRNVDAAPRLYIYVFLL